MAVDLQKVLDITRNKYGKKEKGLSNDLVLGSEIKLATDPSAYVTNEQIQKFWTPLTGLMGFPYGRICQFAGKPDSGKSTLLMMAMIQAQHDDATVVLWDSENKFSSARFAKMGGDPDRLLVARGRTVLEGVKQMGRYIDSIKQVNPKERIYMGWDSVGATENSKEDNEDNDNYSVQPGVQAKEVTYAIKRLNKGIIRGRDIETGQETVALGVVNQVYANIGSVGFKEKGGEQLYYLSSIILQMSRKKDLTRTKKGQKVKYGILTRVKVKKNHLFDGDECIAELDLIVSADGIKLEKDIEGMGIEEWKDED